MPLLETRGAASVQGFGALAASARNYIEDVFSTYLYTGNGSTQTITNGIDLAGKGGLVWTKRRNAAASHRLQDTVRGLGQTIYTDATAAQANEGTTGISGFLSSGYSLGSLPEYNESAATFASWTFRKQAKFFDVVTYTGDGANRTISHNLGSVPGCIIVKRTDVAADWQVYHRSIANTEYLVLNTTAAKATGATRWNSTTPTSTVFSLGTNTTVNASGGTYVAYLFAHDTGGFGEDGSENVISCGLFTTDGSGNATVTLGYEPQWLLVKRSDSSTGGNWVVINNMVGLNAATGNKPGLIPNLSNAESNTFDIRVTSTGFTANVLSLSAAYIYIAIRRGPMKTPTTGTSVFDAQTTASVSSITTTNFSVTVDAYLQANRNLTAVKALFPRLTQLGLLTYSTASESSAGTLTANFGVSPQTSVERPVIGGTSTTGVLYGLVRAPGFFDVVCYTGTGVARTVTHNLGVVPELLIIKKRAGAPDTNWDVNYGFTSTTSNQLVLNLSVAASTNLAYGGATMNAQPTTTTFAVTTVEAVNGNTDTYVAYLFATVAGVSKVGSYTGTGNTLQIDCGFTGGARFVLIKRTDSTGDWYVWDSARGIVAGNDPYLLLNSTAAEVTSTDYVDTYSAGFEISSTAPAAINANGGSFIFLAIA